MVCSAPFKIIKCLPCTIGLIQPCVTHNCKLHLLMAVLPPPVLPLLHCHTVIFHHHFNFPFHHRPPSNDLYPRPHSPSQAKPSCSSLHAHTSHANNFHVRPPMRRRILVTVVLYVVITTPPNTKILTIEPSHTTISLAQLKLRCP